MSFAFQVSANSFSAALKTQEIIARMAALKGITRARDNLKDVLRDQVLAVGFDDRLAKTWQGKVYANEGATREGPAAYVYSKAPKIIDAFARGATIVARNGSRFLALPTDDTPRQRSGGRSQQARAKRPAEVEAQYGRKLRFIPAHSAQGSAISGKAVGYLVMDGLTPRQNRNGLRAASPRELAGTARNKGRLVRSVLMFTLVPRVKMPKLFDLQATAESIAATVPQLIAEEWS